MATEDARPVTAAEGVPWPDHSEQHYVSRFNLTDIIEAPSAVTTWNTPQDGGQFPGMANQGVVRIENGPSRSESNWQPISTLTG